MPKVTLEGHIVVPETLLSAIMTALPAHIELTRKEAGCLQFEVTQRAEDNCIFSVYEEFVNRTAFEAHQARVRTSAWGKISVDVERHYQVTEVSELDP